MRQKQQILIFFFFFIINTLCNDQKVIVLTDQNFQEIVLDSDDIFFIKFYAESCGNSQKMKDDWISLAKMVKSGMKIAELDVDANPKFGTKYSDDGTPTLLLFPSEKNDEKIQEYEDSRKLKDLVEWIKKEVKDVKISETKVEEKTNKPEKTKRKPKIVEEEEVKQEEENDEDLPYETDGDVIILTDDNFDEVVMKNQDAVFIKFYAPWCGHCKKLAPDWKKLATKLKGKVKVAEVDATAQTKLGSRFKVHGYPSLKYFAGGEEKQDSLIRDYEGDRSLHDMKLYALGKRKEDEPYNDKDVTILNKDNFDEIVMKDEEHAWVIAFIAPWDGNSRQLLPDWARLATKMKNELKFGKIDGTEQMELAERFDVTDYPVVKFFPKGQKDDSDVLLYEGQKSFTQIKSWVEMKLKEVAMPDVVVLTDDNFEEIVFGTEKMVFIKFYAPWCGHCQKLAPEWAMLGTTFKDDPDVIIAKMDASVQRKKAEIYEVKGYPTVKLFPMGKKDENTKPMDYEGARTFNELERYINEQRDAQKIIEIKQLISEESYKESCDNKLVRACFIAFLPHIYDCTAEERTQQLEMLKGIAEEMRGKPISFLWAQGGDYYEFEQVMALGTGYPSMFAVSHNKQAFAQMKVAFNEGNIKAFVQNLIDGKESITKFISEKPILRKTEEWDGQDKKPSYDDDYDLDDVELDSDKDEEQHQDL